MLNNLNDWLAHLEKNHPKFLESGLDRINKVAKKLDLLTTNARVITVAGTNGKGSCVALLEAILTSANYRIGAYTSPHLLCYNERIRINQQPIDNGSLYQSFSIIEAARKNIPLTYFEFSTLAALWLFKQASLDVIILEVGIGGRLDAVNIMDADIAVISSVDFDHTELLGNTREAIALEKAGIIRKNKPVVYGDDRLTNNINSIAKEHSAVLYCQNLDFGYEKQTDDSDYWHWWSKQQKLNNLPVPTIFLPNATTTLKVIELLSEQLPIAHSAIEKGLKAVFLPGRFQIVSKNPLVILDVAHNPSAARLLAQQLKTKDCKGKTWAIVGMLADKDVKQTLSFLNEIVDEWSIAELLSPRSCNIEFLDSQLKSLGISAINCFDSISKAYENAFNRAASNDRIILFGSFYTVAEALAHRYNRPH